jgi:hypothetical protein
MAGKNYSPSEVTALANRAERRLERLETAGETPERDPAL